MRRVGVSSSFTLRGTEVIRISLATVNVEPRHYGSSPGFGVGAAVKENRFAAPLEFMNNNVVKREMPTDVKSLGKIWGPIVGKFLRENCLKQAEHEEFLDKRLWFEQLVQGFNLISCLPVEEQEELQNFILEINNKVTEETDSISNEVPDNEPNHGSSEKITNECEYPPALRPRVLMFGSSVVGTAFVNGDVDFALAFPCPEVIGLKINMMRERELKKLDALKAEAERIAKEEEAAEAEERQSEGNDTVVKVRSQRGPQILSLNVNISVTGIFYKSGFMLTVRTVQPTLLSKIYDFIQSNREDMIFSPENSTEAGNGPGTSIDPLTVAALLDEETIDNATKGDLKEGNKMSVNEEMSITDGYTTSPKAASKTKSKILKSLEDDPSIDLTDGDIPHKDKKLTSEKLTLHRIFRARVPIMQFCPPRIGNTPRPTLDDAPERGNDANKTDVNDNITTRNRFMKKGHQSSSATSSPSTTDVFVDKLIMDDIKGVGEGSNSKGAGESEKNMISPDTFSRIFSSKAPKSGIGSFSIAERGQDGSKCLSPNQQFHKGPLSIQTIDSRVLESLDSKRKEYFDVSLSLTGCENSLLMRKYMETYPEVRVSCMILKHWGRKRRILNARRGWLSPYALTILFIYYMERSGAISLIPIDSVFSTFNLISNQMLAEDRQFYSGSGNTPKSYGRLYGVPQFDVCPSPFDNISRTPKDFSSQHGTPVVLPTIDEYFESVPKYLQGFFKFFSDESQFDFDSDVVDIRTTMPVEPEVTHETTEGRDPGEYNTPSQKTQQTHVYGLSSMTEPFNKTKSWRDYRFFTRADWYRALEEENIIDTKERWHRLGYEVLMIRDPYEDHSLARATEFFRAEVIREEMRVAADLKGGGFEDIERLLSSVV